MTIAIFFGGILVGFLMGFIVMALLSAANYENRNEELKEALVYHQIMSGKYRDSVRYLRAD